MLEASQPKDNEIDLFQLFELLWRSKKLLGAFLAISISLGGSFIYIKKPIYESKIFFSVQNKPILSVKNQTIISEYKEMFYSKSLFDVWKSENEKSELLYDHFSITKVINGFTFIRDQSDLLAYFFDDKKEKLSLLVIKTKNLSLINDFFKYANFINIKLTSSYKLRSKVDIKMLQPQLKKDNLPQNSVLFLYMNRFINSAENGRPVIAIKPPIYPEKISPRITLIIALSIFLGGIIGTTFILVKNKIRERKEIGSLMWETFIVLKILVIYISLLFDLFIRVGDNFKRKLRGFNESKLKQKMVYSSN